LISQASLKVGFDRYYQLAESLALVLTASRVLHLSRYLSQLLLDILFKGVDDPDDFVLASLVPEAHIGQLSELG
jgi:hypothetical protein